VFAPIYFKDDFNAQVAFDTAPSPWGNVESTGTVDTIPDYAGGQVKCLTSGAASDQKALASFGDSTILNLGVTTTSKYFQFECRVMVTTLTTDLGGHHFLVGLGVAVTSDLTGTDYLYGTAADVFHGFYIGPSMTNTSQTEDTSLYIASDDGAGTNDNFVDTGTNLVQGTWYVLRGDFSVKTGAKFYNNGTRLSSSSTFNVSGMTTGDALVQPVFGVYKHTTEGDVGSGAMYVDYFAYWGVR